SGCRGWGRRWRSWASKGRFDSRRRHRHTWASGDFLRSRHEIASAAPCDGVPLRGDRRTGGIRRGSAAVASDYRRAFPVHDPARRQFHQTGIALRRRLRDHRGRERLAARFAAYGGQHADDRQPARGARGDARRDRDQSAAAVGRVAPQWRTPVGRFKVVQLRKDPTWHVPASIIREAEIEGKDIEDFVPPGPDNPLGGYWIGLNFGSLGIHGTNSPLGIYGFHTHGCIRLGPKNAESLFDSTEIGEKGEIIYAPTLLAHLDDGRVFLEVNRDAYKRGGGGMDHVRRVAEENHLSHLIDWSKAQQVADRAEGVARDVTAEAPGEARR